MVRPDGPRDPIAGPDVPEAPFPLKLQGPVVRGFGRGSKELGIPTANIPPTALTTIGQDALDSGIYYGFASLDLSTIPTSNPSLTDPIPKSSNHAVFDLEEPATAPSSQPPSRPLTPSHSTSKAKAKALKVYPAVLSIGYNPVYKNKERSIEIHLLHTFAQDFYGATLRLVMLGFIRPEYDYVSKDALVEDIREDIRISQRSLAREAYVRWKEDAWLLGGGEVEGLKQEVENGIPPEGMCQMAN